MASFAKVFFWGLFGLCWGILSACGAPFKGAASESHQEFERKRLEENKLREERRQAIEKEQFLMWEEMRK